MIRRAPWLLALLAAGCIGDLESYTCDDGHLCQTGRACLNGSCATIDENCPSGYRWDESSGGRSGQCAESPPDMGRHPDQTPPPPPTCGNSKVDKDELCDDGPGSPKTCPTVKSCEDANPCTTARLAGGPCNYECVNELIPAGSPCTSAEGKPGTCSDTCCTGCLDGQGHCQAGVAKTACGAGGVACVTCADTCDASGACGSCAKMCSGGKNCGSDGCGGTCGTCKSGEKCSSSGICECAGSKESTDGQCSDGKDNDCNTKIDCKDDGCDGKTCSPSGDSYCFGKTCLKACVIAKKVWTENQRNPDQPCEYCDPARPTVWTVRADGDACSVGGSSTMAGTPGKCWSGRCCTGCWSKSQQVCVLGPSWNASKACTAAGAECGGKCSDAGTLCKPRVCVGGSCVVDVQLPTGVACGDGMACASCTSASCSQCIKGVKTCQADGRCVGAVNEGVVCCPPDRCCSSGSGTGTADLASCGACP